MYGEESTFQASYGWQWRFCKRHGIRNLTMQGEKCLQIKIVLKIS